MTEETKFKEVLKSRGMRVTGTRLKVLKEFLKTEEHVTVEELYRNVQQKHPGIGYATVHRTLKLLADHGLAYETDFGDRISRFEHRYDHPHHDHLICEECRRTIEFCSTAIEREQERIVKKYGFKPVRHTMQIFGICRECQKKEKSA